MGRDDFLSNKDATGIDYDAWNQSYSQKGNGEGGLYFYFRTFQVKCWSDTSQLRDGWQ